MDHLGLLVSRVCMDILLLAYTLPEIKFMLIKQLGKNWDLKVYIGKISYLG